MEKRFFYEKGAFLAQKQRFTRKSTTKFTQNSGFLENLGKKSAKRLILPGSTDRFGRCIVKMADYFRHDIEFGRFQCYN
jgi:hypothetical protein